MGLAVKLVVAVILLNGQELDLKPVFKTPDECHLFRRSAQEGDLKDARILCVELTQGASLLEMARR